MTGDSIDAYEKHALHFLERRDTSSVGSRIVKSWACQQPINANVIEIACGGGIPITQSLVDAGLNIHVIDSSPTLIAVFKKRFPDIPAQCASVLTSDFFARQYDAAVAVGLIFLLSQAEQMRMLNRISAVLAPNASFLFTAPLETRTWIDINTAHACVSLGRDGYLTALDRAGFRFVKNHEDTGGNNYYEAERVADN